MAGGGKASVEITDGVDLVAFSGILAFSFSCCDLLGGSGGKVEGSYAGALTLPASIDGVLEPEVIAVLFDNADIEEMLEMAEDTDSIESLLLSWSEGLLGGNAGEGFAVGRLGSFGVAGSGCGAGFCPVRVIAGGGNTPFW